MALHSIGLPPEVPLYHGDHGTLTPQKLHEADRARDEAASPFSADPETETYLIELTDMRHLGGAAARGAILNEEPNPREQE